MRGWIVTNSVLVHVDRDRDRNRCLCFARRRPAEGTNIVCISGDTYYNTLQRTATYCNTLQHTAIYCNILQHTTTHDNLLPNTATHCNTLPKPHTLEMWCEQTVGQSFGLLQSGLAAPCLWIRLFPVAVCCSVLQCVAVCCSVLQCAAVCQCGNEVGRKQHALK